MLGYPPPGTIDFGVKMRNGEAEDERCGADAPAVAKILREMHRVAGGVDLKAKIEGMRRYGIRPQRMIGLSVPQLRTLARTLTREHGLDQRLAEALWETGIHDALVLASLVGDPGKITPRVMERWARDFASWDVCDACCCNLFDRSPHAWTQVEKFARSPDEFVRRAAFSMTAAIAVHDKAAEDSVFLNALPLIEKYAFDERNFVRKALNWALRSIGKRNAALREAAIACAERIRAQGTPSARWIAADALRELRS